MNIDTAIDVSKSRIDKLRAFKVAIVNKFERETFEEFVQVLRDSANQLYKISIVGQDANNHKFELFISSFEFKPFNGCVLLTINYKWSKSSDKPSNWHKEELLLYSGRYQDYKHDANRIYKKAKADDTADPAFEQWKKDHPSTYEILFSLLLRWADICKGIHGYDKVAHMWQHHTNSTRRWSSAHPHVATHVVRYRILKIYLNSMAQTFAIEVELEHLNGLGVVKSSHYISEIVHGDIVCDIEDEVMKYLTGKSEEDKPGSTETQNAIERMLKNSFYGTQAISLFDGKAHIDTDTPWTTNPDLNRKVMEYAENDAKAVSAMYEELNKEKETKEMKKLIINHNAVVVLFGVKDSAGKAVKTVVNILDRDTKEERGPWNTKLAVVSAIAKSFEHTRDGKHSTCYKLYEMLNTIKKPTNATIDFVADEMYQNGKRLKNYKWYQEAIKVKRPAPGKSVVIVMEDK